MLFHTRGANVLRREFCKIMAVAAASKALPVLGQTRAKTQSELPIGFDQYSQTYDQFCALPPDKRTFYELNGGRILQATLDNATWKSPEWGKPPVLPIAGGSWDG